MRTKLPHEIKSEETKQKIIDATERMLAQYDFKYLTVRNICEESGVAYGSFYHHFSSKENLLYIYTAGLYQKMYQANPVPDWIDPKDYVKCVLWHLVVYGSFCEAVGKDLTGYLYENCRQDIFDETYQKDILPRIEEAEENGYIDAMRGKQNVRPYELLIKDMAIISKGVVFWWCRSGDDNTEALHETLEHTGFNMLYSYSSDKYRDAEYKHCLITEDQNFPGSVKMEGINIKHEE